MVYFKPNFSAGNICNYIHYFVIRSIEIQIEEYCHYSQRVKRKMASFISLASVGILPASFRLAEHIPTKWSQVNAGGGSLMKLECSSRPKKKGTAHHMKTRPKKTQPWDVKRKGPTLYPSLPPLPPEWMFASDDDAGKDSASLPAAADVSL